MVDVILFFVSTVLPRGYRPSTAYAGAHGLTFLRCFVQAIRGGSPLPARGEDALAVAWAVAAAYRSADGQIHSL